MSKETKLCLYRLYSKDFDNVKDIDLTELVKRDKPCITLVKTGEEPVQITLDDEKLYKEKRNTLGVSSKHIATKYVLMGDPYDITIVTKDLIRIVRRLLPEYKVIHMLANVTISGVDFTTVTNVLNGAVTKNVIIDNCKI